MATILRKQGENINGGAVDTNFIGTTAEWNALSQAQQNAYDTVDITDDNEASGAVERGDIISFIAQNVIDGTSIDVSNYVSNATNYAWYGSGYNNMVIIRGFTSTSNDTIGVSIGKWNDSSIAETDPKNIYILGVKLID